MPNPVYNLSSSLKTRYKSLEGTRKRVEDLYDQNLISLRVLLHVYEGLFLSVHTAFEVFIEELFIKLLVHGAEFSFHGSTVRPRIKVNSYKVARELIYGPGKKYTDWLPYERTINIANLYFRGGRPFTILPRDIQQHINHSTIIRNAIAHKSRHSRDRFFNSVNQHVRLPPRQRNVVGYLRDHYAYSPPQTRYEVIVAQLFNAAITLTV